MCGIAGFISPNDQTSLSNREDILDRMCKIITHRGPDEQGTVVRGKAALGMRRLSIIDIKSGQQPIFNDDESLAIVFNGEIYNYRELKTDLEQKGYRFKTNSDTETILLAYQEYGAEAVKKLRGMFAFAIWNFQDEELFIARDRIGKKPLFYSLTTDGSFVFGSELKSLRLFPTVDLTVDPLAVNSYLTFGYVPEQQCIYRSVNKLEPGHSLTFKGGKIATSAYWDIEFCDSFSKLSESDYIDQLREKLVDAVKCRLISEVPLGAFLSGGVDSSAVVGLMSQVMSEPVKTFSIGFNEDSFNELKFARIAAQHFGTDHHEFVVTPNVVEIVGDIVWHFDEPFADASSLPTFIVSKMAREYVTVVLSGDGGDELFGGYTRYNTYQNRGLSDKLPSFIKGSLGWLSRILPHSALGKNFLYNLSLSSIDRYIDLVTHFNIPQRSELLHPAYWEQLQHVIGYPEELFREISLRPDSSSMLERVLYLDSKTYLPGDVMTKVDRMTMANSLEARSPLLDHNIVEFASKIPMNLKLKGSETKYIFKKAMEGIVPKEILYREKQGFGVPLKEWINNELREMIRDTLLDETTASRELLNIKYIEVLLDEHGSKRRDHSYALWSLFVLELWFRSSSIGR